MTEIVKDLKDRTELTEKTERPPLCGGVDGEETSETLTPSRLSPNSGAGARPPGSGVGERGFPVAARARGIPTAVRRAEGQGGVAAAQKA